MRRRPEVVVYLRPPNGSPGQSLEAEILLTSKSETPTEGIDVQLEGIESMAVPSGNHQQIVTQVHVAKQAKFPARKLTAGEHRMAVRFDIPTNAPATYDRNASVHYVLSVHVHIPWWLDRDARFEVPVRPLLRPPPETRARVYSTDPQGARPKELLIETSLDREQLTPGSVLGGAVAISQIGSRDIRQVKLELLAFEEPSEIWSKNKSIWAASPPSREVFRYEYVLVDGAPGEAVPHRFSIRIPENVPPTFDAHYFVLRWYLRVAVSVHWGSDASMMAPITIVAANVPTTETVGRPTAVPPVGRERRALVWAAVATRHHLQNDAEAERMEGRVGSVTTSIALEQRGEGLHCVATLAWPTLGLDLELHERGWTETLKFGEASLEEFEGTEKFVKRLALFGRDRTRVAALFAASETRDALLRFDEVHVDDEGGVLASRNGVNAVDELGAFVAAALEAARVLDSTIAKRMTPPKAMAEALDAWRALANRLGGSLELGRMWIHDAESRGERGEIGTRWKDETMLDTLVRVVPSSKIERRIELDDPEIDPQVRTLAQEILNADGTRSIRIGPDDLEAILPAPLVDPGAAESIFERLSQIASALRTGRDLGPYR